MAEAVKVIVRCRPMNGREKGLNCKTVVSMDSKVGQCVITNPNDSKAPPKSFTFDGAYFVDSTTEQIYADIGYPLVEGVTEGYNGTIFAYGQTGCGKSFSMQGIQDPATQRGIIPRAFAHIFETIQVSEGVKYLVHGTYLEIYNEEIRDLLGKDVKTKLDLKEHPERGVYVQNLSMHPVKNVHDCEKVMEKGWKNRSTGSTLMNADSSRSHSIFTIHLERSDLDENGEEHIRAAKLNLVDLAGSERQAKTGATGDRLKEATKINLSLSALGNVISALVDGKSKHIPYRDSKLTRLLQDSLGGNTKTLMVACLSPADNNYDETLSTLRYANRAKNIKNKPKINEDPKDALLREYHDEIERLKAMLRGEIPVDVESGGGQGAAPARVQTKVIEKVVHVNNAEEVEAEKQRIKQEYEKEMNDMKANYEAMRMDKEALQDEMSKLRSRYDSEMAMVEQHAQHIPSPGQTGVINGVAADGANSTEMRNGEQIVNGYSGTPQGQPLMPGHQDMMSGTTPVPDMTPEDAVYMQQTPSQKAIHLGTTREDGTPLAPRSSPTGTHPSVAAAQHEEALRRPSVVENPTEAMQRLQELQAQMVGGEQATNEEVKEIRRKKKRYAEERRVKLAAEVQKMEDSGIMLNIYDNIHDELKAKNRLLEKERNRTSSLQQEIMDLQSEFEFDRIDYLDTIRKQEQQMKLLQSIIEKIHPCLRRDCNYANLDRIKANCEWDEEGQRWLLPKMTIEKTKLPPAGVMPGVRQEEPRRHMNGEVHASIYDDLRSEDRYLQKLHRNTEQDIANNYFKSKRTDLLLNKTQEDKNRRPMYAVADLRSTSPNVPVHMMNGNTHSPPSGSPGPSQDHLRAAQVHGQISSDEAPMRKPQRLESLAAPSAKRRGKKKTMNTMEAL